MTTYDPMLSLTENLRRNGFSHRAAGYGKRQVFLIGGEDVGAPMDHTECTEWLKALVRRPAVKGE